MKRQARSLLRRVSRGGSFLFFFLLLGGELLCNHALSLLFCHLGSFRLASSRVISCSGGSFILLFLFDRNILLWCISIDSSWLLGFGFSGFELFWRLCLSLSLGLRLFARRCNFGLRGILNWSLFHRLSSAGSHFLLRLVMLRSALLGRFFLGPRCFNDRLTCAFLGLLGLRLLLVPLVISFWGIATRGALASAFLVIAIFALSGSLFLLFDVVIDVVVANLETSLLELLLHEFDQLLIVVD